MIPIFVNVRQKEFLPDVQVIIEGLKCKDEQWLFSVMFRIMEFANKKRAIFIPEMDIPPITKGKQIQVSFTARFQSMSDADFFVNGISSML